MSVTLLHEAEIKRASEADRIWFERHPGRRFRMRDPVPFEFNVRVKPPPSGMSWRLIVASIDGMGMRFKLHVASSNEVGNDEVADETLREIFTAMAPSYLIEAYRTVIGKEHEPSAAPVQRMFLVKSGVVGRPPNDGAENEQSAE